MADNSPRLNPILLRAVILSLTLGLCATSNAFGLQVTGDSDRDTVRVGDTITVTIRGERDTTDPSFLGANVHVSGQWQRGGQTVESPRSSNGRIIKIWHFQLVAAVTGSASVTPVIYLGQDMSVGAQADSMLGSPISVVIEDVPASRAWPWSIPPIIVILVAIAIARRRRRRKEAESYVRPQLPPLAEALEMLDSIRVNRREDRAQTYLSDLERVILGYLTRRLGHPLTGQTAAQVQSMAAAHLPDPGANQGLTNLMTAYSTAKFGAIQMNYEQLVSLESQAREVLEHLEATWV